jgi:predicted enzyme related to lactoylglutathione lyase
MIDSAHSIRRVAPSPWRQGICVAMLCLAGAASEAAPRLQPLQEQPNADHHVGKFIFVELVTPDLSAAKNFYSGMFGWTFQDILVAGDTYSEASLGGRPVAGIVQRAIHSNRNRQPAWLNFIAVTDVDATSKAALAHGAKPLSPPHDLPDRGRVAVLADPQGAVFGVLAATGGDPPDVLAQPGEWIWHSLFATDPDTEAGFYQTIFDYEVFDLPAGPHSQHVILASEDFARASANTLPASSNPVHSHWLSYVRVRDATESAAHAVSLGGRILVAPRMDRQGGMVSVVADPQGAPVGLLEWPDIQSTKEAQ